MQRANTPSQDIVLRQTNDEGGDEMGHNSDPDHSNRAFQERYANAVTAFKEYREGASFASRVNRDILCAMCETAGLSTSGYKVELFARLKKWVRCSKFNSFVHLVI